MRQCDIPASSVAHETRLNLKRTTSEKGRCREALRYANGATSQKMRSLLGGLPTALFALVSPLFRGIQWDPLIPDAAV